MTRPRRTLTENVRQSHAVNERARGRTWADIGADLGVSAQRARQLWEAWHARQQRQRDDMLAAAEREREWARKRDEYLRWRARVDDLCRVVEWWRHRGGAAAFAEWESRSADTPRQRGKVWPQ